MHHPSMQALRALDGLAKHGSMLEASRELNLTPSAISHQLRSLETALGQKLFHRQGKGVTLTAFGKRYAQEVEKALSIVSWANLLTEDNVPAGRLRLSCVPGFAIFWLCNHLAEFQQLYPQISLEISSPHRLADVWDRDIELFIAFGKGNWPGMQCELLSDIEFTPYCCPSFLEDRGGLLTLENLREIPLLHMGGYDDWSRWIAASGEIIDPRHGIVFSNMYLVLSAAVRGLGVAIGDNLTCKTALEQGQLVKPFGLSIRSLESYFLVYEPGIMERSTCRAFAEWLRSKLQADAFDESETLGPEDFSASR